MSAFEPYSLKHEQTWDSPTIKRISLSSHVCPGFLRKSHNNYANQCKEHFSSLPRHKMQKKKYTIATASIIFNLVRLVIVQCYYQDQLYKEKSDASYRRRFLNDDDDDDDNNNDNNIIIMIIIIIITIIIFIINICVLLAKMHLLQIYDAVRISFKKRLMQDESYFLPY